LKTETWTSVALSVEAFPSMEPSLKFYSGKIHSSQHLAGEAESLYLFRLIERGLFGTSRMEILKGSQPEGELIVE